MNYTDRQLQNGFWIWDKSIDFPPESISYPSQYNGQEKLNINCTQLLGITPTEQKKLIKQWVEFFQTLKNVKFIWFTSNVTQELFDGVCKVNSLEGLSIKWSGIKTLENIYQLSNLKYLKVGSSAKIESVEPLTTLNKLEVLSTENFKKITDFSTLGKLQTLKFLAIEGGMYSKQNVDSFDFLCNLKQLVYLRTAAIKTIYQDINCLLDLSELVTLHWGFDIKSNDIEKLKSTLPRLKYYPGNYGFDNEKYLKSVFGQK